MNTCFPAHGAVLRVVGHSEGRAWLVKVAHGGKGSLKVLSASGVIMPSLPSALLRRKTCCQKLLLPWRSRLYHHVATTLMDGVSGSMWQSKPSPLGLVLSGIWGRVLRKTTNTRKARAEEMAKDNKRLVINNCVGVGQG